MSRVDVTIHRPGEPPNWGNVPATVSPSRVVAPGASIGAPTVVAGKAGSGVYPAYPPMLSGWKLQASQIDTSRDQGWSQTTGIINTSAAYNRPANCSFGVGPDNDAVRIVVTYDGTSYYSAEIRAAFCVLQPDHVIEWYQYMGPLGAGSFPAAWERPSGAGDGEIDWFEWKGKWFISGGPTDPNRIAMNTIVTRNGSYPSPTIQHVTNLAVDANGVDPQSVWQHWRVRCLDGVSHTVWINGIQVGQITRAQALNTMTATDYDNCFGSNHNWYFRLSYQFGNGAKSTAAGTPDPSLCPTSYYVRDVRVYELV